MVFHFFHISWVMCVGKGKEKAFFIQKRKEESFMKYVTRSMGIPSFLLTLGIVVTRKPDMLYYFATSPSSAAAFE